MFPTLIKYSSHFLSLICLIIILFPLCCRAIPIPNGQVGKAEVECAQDDIEVVFLTEDTFQGRVFVVGHANESDCVSRDVGKKSTSIIVRKDRCGVITIRSQNPPGLFVNVRVMISFHDEFITKVDRGYEISCFYMEAEKTVTFPITVEPNTLQPFTEFAEMPRCRYEVVDPTNREPVSVVSVGSKLLHKWICDSTAPDLWCMTVHSCFVEDGSGTEFQILTDEGCAIDRYLLDNLEYGPGPLEAQKEAHAFKFADRVVVNFQCSIRLDIRDGECPIPKCPDLSQQKPRLTRRALAPQAEEGRENNGGFVEVDVRAPQIDIFDPEIDFDTADSIHSMAILNQKRLLSSINEQFQSSGIRRHQSLSRCIPLEDLAFPASLLGALSLAMSLVIIFLCFERRHQFSPEQRELERN